MSKPTVFNVTGVTDPIGMLLTCVVGIAGLFGLPELLQWDASDVMTFLGFTGMGAAAIRTIWKAKKLGEPLPEGEMPALPKAE